MPRVGRLRRRRRDEHGAVAVLVALCSLLLLSIAALAVDMGNAWTQRREVQTEADLAALAGGALLPAETDAQKLLIATEVLEYLRSNQTYGQDDGDSAGWTVAQLLDENASGTPNLTNGQVLFPTPNSLTVVAPPSTVEFGFAGVMEGVGDSTDVQAEATVEIRSPGSMLPMFLLTGCSWGSQIIKDGNQRPEPEPIFVPAVTTGSVDAALHSQPEPVAANASSTITLQGDDFTGVTDVHFTRDDTNVQAPATDVTAGFSGRPKVLASLKVALPSAVTNQPGTWFIRLETSAGLTRDRDALPINVVLGNAAPGCGTSSTGDFGLLQSPRGDVPNGSWLERNIAVGLDHSVAIWPTDPAQVGGKCPSTAVAGTTPILDYDPSRNPAVVDGANCVNIYTGNQVSKVTSGLVQRLSPATRSGCDRHGGSSPAIITGKSLNNDVLSCYLPADGTTVGQISQEVGAPEHVLDEAIFKSPRFFWVPMINGSVNPQNGDYALVEYRAVFITDESFAACNGCSDGDATTRNGIVANNSQISLLQVVAFDAASLPETVANGGGASIPYTGSGTRVISLIR